MAVTKLKEIKDTIKDLFISSNIEGFSPRDLSRDMNNRVKSVVVLNPEEHLIQATQLPSVAIWNDQKNITPTSIGKNQLSVKREAVMDIFIAGIVFQASRVEFDQDLADNDTENLMENIEQILRSDPNLSGTALWQFPTRVQYYNVSTREETLYKVGLMSLAIKVFY